MDDRFATLFGELRRRNTDMSLREFCEANGFDPGYVSKVERGKLPPPPAGKIEDYARALGLRADSVEWMKFVDFAAAARGEIPSDILENEELMDMMPVLFREMRREAGASDATADPRVARLLHIINTA